MSHRPLVIKRVGLISGVNIIVRPLVYPWPGINQGITPRFPRVFEEDFCTGGDHVTFHRVTDWTVTAGEFDPFDLHQGVLSRYVSSNTQATQTLQNIQTGVVYTINVAGDAIVSFGGGAPVFEWNGDPTQNTNQLYMKDVSATVKFTNSVPVNISVKFTSNSNQLSSIDMTDPSSTSVVKNPTFTTQQEFYYDIESWFADSAEVPTNTLGYLLGFSDHLAFTLFE